MANTGSLLHLGRNVSADINITIKLFLHKVKRSKKDDETPDIGFPDDSVHDDNIVFCSS